MWSLKPFTTLLLGTLLAAIVVTGVGMIALPNARGLQDFAVFFGVGVLFGIFIFLPITAGESSRSRFVVRHFHKLERWSALAMAMGMGHMLLRAVGDGSSLVAFGLIMFGAAFRVYLSEVAKKVPS